MVYDLWLMVHGLWLIFSWFVIDGLAVVERGWNTFQTSQDFRMQNGSSQNQYLALTVLFVVLLLDTG